MDEFTDDLTPVPVDTHQPHTVAAVLWKLCMSAAPAVDQERAIAEWVASHPPSETMRRSLRRNGYGHLLT